MIKLFKKIFQSIYCFMMIERLFLTQLFRVVFDLTYFIGGGEAKNTFLNNSPRITQTLEKHW